MRSRMPAMVVLHALKPPEQLTVEVLDRLRDHLERADPLPIGPGNRVEIPFLSIDQAEALEDVERGLDGAGRNLNIDWRDYFYLALPSI